MPKENTLFEDGPESDFEAELEDILNEDPLGLSGKDSDGDGLDLDMFAELDEAADETPFSDPAAGAAMMQDASTVNKMLPAISIRVFYELDDTLQTLQSCADDRRMSRTQFEAAPGGIPAAIEYMKVNPTPNLLIIESTAAAPQVIQQVDTLAEYCDSHVQVMIIGKVNDIALYRQLVARGVSEYIVPPLSPLQIIGAISELFTDPEAPFTGKQFSVIGAKGGVGASTIAHNLAWALAENIRVNTTLVDLDLSFGTTALDFNQETAQTVVDALLAPERADDAVIGRLLTKASDRLSLFTAPATLSQIMDISDNAYSSVIDVVRHNVPYVVLDLPHQWSSWVMNTLVASDEVIIVCQPDLASLRNGKNMIDQVSSKRPNDNPPRLVINMTGVPKRPEVPVKDFAAAIGIEPDIILPFEPELFGTAANNGQMIGEADPSSKSSIAVDHLAASLSGHTARVYQKSLFQKLLGK